LITNTLQVSKVFMTPIMIFEKTPNQEKVIIVPTCFQILSQVKLVEETSAELVKGAVNQPIVEDQKNLDI